ncbi:MAG: hypothetical protein WC536_02030 [Patescibacteria group bacterium]
MKHYRIVKRTASALIAIGTFAIIFNTTLLIAAAINLFAPNESMRVKAACDSSAPATYTLIPSEDVTKKVTLSLNKLDINNKIKYKIEIRKVGYDNYNNYYENDIYTSYGEAEPGFSNGFSPNPVVIPISEAGDYKAVVSYENLTTGCKYNVLSDQIQSFSFTNNGAVALHGEIELSADPETINLKNSDGTDNTDASTMIKYRFSGHADEVYHIWITDCAGNYIDKMQDAQIISADPDPASGYIEMPWSPQEKTCIYHKVRIKTFIDAGTDSPMTGQAEITVNISGSEGQTPGSEGSSTDTDKLTVPNNFSTVLAKLASGFPLHSEINGIGDLALLIVELLEWAIGVLAFIGIMISGIQYITAGGDTAKAEKAKKALMYSIIGIVAATLSLTIQTIAANFWSGPK